MSDRFLLIIAHGSRRQASNDEVRVLAEQVRADKGEDLEDVEVAFLELAEPTIAEGLENCLRRGAAQIIVLPYFLAAGTHVAEDIPAAIEAFRQAHPDIRVHLTAHLGESDALPRAILDMAVMRP